MTVCPDCREDREAKIKARLDEYRAGLSSEAVTRAYLHSMRLRGEDVTHRLEEFAPEPAETYEQRREAATVREMRERQVRYDVRRRLRQEAERRRRC